MNRVAVAQELVKVAKDLMAGTSFESIMTPIYEAAKKKLISEYTQALKAAGIDVIGVTDNSGVLDFSGVNFEVRKNGKKFFLHLSNSGLSVYATGDALRQHGAFGMGTAFRNISTLSKAIDKLT